MTGWRSCKCWTRFLLVAGGTCLGSSAHALGGFDQEKRIKDEIVVVGTPPTTSGFGAIGGWLSFATVDISDQFRSLDHFLSALNAVNDRLIEASEQYCSQKIEQWRRDCHDGMETAHTYCIVSGAFMTGSLIRARIPAPFRSSGSIGAGVGTLSTCNSIRFRAHRNCDRIADSDAAARIAECPGE